MASDAPFVFGLYVGAEARVAALSATLPKTLKALFKLKPPAISWVDLVALANCLPVSAAVPAARPFEFSVA